MSNVYRLGIQRIFKFFKSIKAPITSTDVSTIYHYHSQESFVVRLGHAIMKKPFRVLLTIAIKINPVAIEFKVIKNEKLIS